MTGYWSPPNSASEPMRSAAPTITATSRATQAPVRRSGSGW